METRDEGATLQTGRHVIGEAGRDNCASNGVQRERSGKVQALMEMKMNGPKGTPDE